MLSITSQLIYSFIILLRKKDEKNIHGFSLGLYRQGYKQSNQYLPAWEIRLSTRYLDVQYRHVQ